MAGIVDVIVTIAGTDSHSEETLATTEVYRLEFESLEQARDWVHDASLTKPGSGLMNHEQLVAK
jgi:hypothetical protein